MTGRGPTLKPPRRQLVPTLRSAIWSRGMPPAERRSRPEGVDWSHGDSCHARPNLAAPVRCTWHCCLTSDSAYVHPGTGDMAGPQTDAADCSRRYTGEVAIACFGSCENLAFDSVGTRRRPTSTASANVTSALSAAAPISDLASDALSREFRFVVLVDAHRLPCRTDVTSGLNQQFGGSLNDHKFIASGPTVLDGAADAPKRRRLVSRRSRT